MDHSQMEVTMRNKKLRSGICIFLAVLLLFTLVMGAIGSIGAAAVDQSDIDALERQKEEITAQKNFSRSRPLCSSRRPRSTSRTSSPYSR